MRIYRDFKEAMGEVKRDLAEMGVRVHARTYQNKVIEGDPLMAQREIQCYSYAVTQPSLADLNPTQPWADAEFNERVTGELNPGRAWLLRKEVWEQFLNQSGEFDYTYGERMQPELDRVVRILKEDNDTRQAFLSIWDPVDVWDAGGVRRIPCTIGYHFMIRRGKLDMTYLQRSADFATHFTNDVYLAHRLQRHVADLVGPPCGVYQHWIGSLHVFQKDVEGTF